MDDSNGRLAALRQRLTALADRDQPDGLTTGFLGAVMMLGNSASYLVQPVDRRAGERSKGVAIASTGQLNEILHAASPTRGHLPR